MRTRSQAAAELIVTLERLPDDTLQQMIDAFCDTANALPLFEAVKGLGGVSKAMRQQIYRLRPLVGVESVAVVQRHALKVSPSSPSKASRRRCRGPWRVSLLYKGRLTGDVVVQARQGRVRSIQSAFFMLPYDVKHHMVPDLLGAGGSLLELDISRSGLDNTWAATFGEAPVCSAVLRTLNLSGCRLRGPLPELRLPALQMLDLSCNQLAGGLEPVRNCTALQALNLSDNQLTGGLEPLRGCTALQKLELMGNQLTGELEPLLGCKALRSPLSLQGTQLAPTQEEAWHFFKQGVEIITDTTTLTDAAVAQ